MQTYLAKHSDDVPRVHLDAVVDLIRRQRQKQISHGLEIIERQILQAIQPLK